MRVARLIPSVAVLGSTALVGLAAAGCASNQPTSPAVTASSRVSAAPTGLAAKLLTAKDMPAGWSLDTAAHNPSMATTCPLLNSSLWNGPMSEHAEADLNAGLVGPSLVEQIASGDAAQMNRSWNTMVAGLSQCSSFTHTASSGGSTFTITRLPSFPVYGDASYAFNLEIAITGGVKGTGNIVATRKGSTIAVIYLAGVADVTPELMEQLTAKAVSKL